MMDETRLLNYLKGFSDADESAQVEAWCMESEEHRRSLEELYFTMQVGERHAALGRVNADRSFSELQPRIERLSSLKTPSRSKSIRRWGIAVAAFVIGVVCASSLFFFGNDDLAVLSVSTAPRQRAQVVLPDGSKAWLNASTTLHYKSSMFRRERCVDLQGEAYFEVARNERSPFIVSAKGIKTEVLGTKFNVKAKVEERVVTTTLLEGVVRVVLPNQQEEGFVLRPGQSVKVDTHTFQSELKDMVLAQDVLLWIDGHIDFKEASLLEITERLSRYYDVNFEFQDERLKKENFTCLFRTDDRIEEIMNALTLTKRFQSRIEGKHIILSVK